MGRRGGTGRLAMRKQSLANTVSEPAPLAPAPRPRSGPTTPCGPAMVAAAASSRCAMPSSSSSPPASREAACLGSSGQLACRGAAACLPRQGGPSALPMAAAARQPLSLHPSPSPHGCSREIAPQDRRYHRLHPQPAAAQREGPGACTAARPPNMHVCAPHVHLFMNCCFRLPRAPLQHAPLPAASPLLPLSGCVPSLPGCAGGARAHQGGPGPV